MQTRERESWEYGSRHATAHSSGVRFRWTCTPVACLPLSTSSLQSPCANTCMASCLTYPGALLQLSPTPKKLRGRFFAPGHKPHLQAMHSGIRLPYDIMLSPICYLLLTTCYLLLTTCNLLLTTYYLLLATYYLLLNTYFLLLST